MRVSTKNDLKGYSGGGESTITKEHQRLIIEWDGKKSGSWALQGIGKWSRKREEHCDANGIFSTQPLSCKNLCSDSNFLTIVLGFHNIKEFLLAEQSFIRLLFLLVTPANLKRDYYKIGNWLWNFWSFFLLFHHTVEKQQAIKDMWKTNMFGL